MKGLKKLFFFLLTVTLMFLWTSPVLALRMEQMDTQFPYMGRVKGTGVNVRAVARIGAEIMYQLEPGTDTLIIGEESGWLRIKAPDDATAWVFSDLVKEETIVKDNVNIRAGASLSSSVLGRLHEGDPVMILQQFEDWYQIEMPLGMGYYVHRDYVKYLCPLEEYDYFLEKEKKTKQLYREAETYRRTELRKRYFEVNYDLLIQKYQKIIDFYPDSMEAEKSLKRIADAQEKKTIAQTRIKSGKLNKKIIQAYDKAEEARRKIIYEDSFDPSDYDRVLGMYQDIIKTYPDSRAARESLKRVSQLKQAKEKKMRDWESQSEFTFQGTLEQGTTETTEKATHKITGISGEVLGYLYSEDIDLRAYEDRIVTVIGMKYVSTQSPTGKQIPVLKLKKISLD